MMREIVNSEIVNCTPLICDDSLRLTQNQPPFKIKEKAWIVMNVECLMMREIVDSEIVNSKLYTPDMC